MKWLKKGVVLTFAFSTMAGAGLAAAQETPSFEELDQDGNGFLDQNEVQGVPGIDMEMADTDGDNQLSQSEFEAAMPEKQ